MKRLPVAVAALTLAVPAAAGENPCSAAFVTFDPDLSDPYVFTTDFTGTHIYDFYICVECVWGGLRSVSLSCTLSGGLCFQPDYTVFDSTAHAEGGPNQDFWVISADTCVYPDEYGISDLVFVARVPVYVMYEGVTMTLGPHPVDGQRLVDCNFEADYFCVCSNGLVGWGYPPPTNQPCECSWPCECVTPVEPGTWGSVKALYR